MERKAFKDVYNDLQYVAVENTIEKYADDVAAEIIEKISSYGWPAADSRDACDWWLEDHQEVNPSGWEESTVADLDFLCENRYMIGDHDVDYYTFHISFFGDWGKEGIFIVTH